MDDLSKELNSPTIGSNAGSKLIKHLCFADNLTLISLYSVCTEKLLSLAICNKYSIVYRYDSLNL